MPEADAHALGVVKNFHVSVIRPSMCKTSDALPQCVRVKRPILMTDYPADSAHIEKKDGM